jgi:ATP-dependent Clp protease ATP-binding subunit ClpA
MPKINVYLPDELADAVREAGVPVSAVCQRALEQAARRITAIRQVALADLDLDDATARLVSFTDRARTAVRLAVEQARADGAREVGTEHLLAGLLAEGGNLAIKILQSIEVEPRQVARELAARAGTGSAEGGPGGGDGGGLRFGGPAAAALELTVTEATSLGHNYVGCEHLLLGLLAEPDGTAGQVLRAAGADQRMTRNAVVAALTGFAHVRDQMLQNQNRSAAAGGQGAGDTGPAAAAFTAAVRRELEPLARRLDRVEQRLAALGG